VKSYTKKTDVRILTSQLMAFVDEKAAERKGYHKQLVIPDITLAAL